MRLSILAWVMCVIGAVAVGIQWNMQLPITERSVDHVVAGVKIGGAFTLTDHMGKQVTDRSWPDQYLLVYFGFTHCPDVCPLGLNTLTEALHALPAKTVKQIQPLFITVDPERDTVKMLRDYMPAFHEKLIGLTGTAAQIDAVKKAYRVFAQKQGDGADYMVNHSAFTYLMAPNGNLLHVFPHNTTSEAMAEQIKKSMVL